MHSYRSLARQHFGAELLDNVRYALEALAKYAGWSQGRYHLAVAGGSARQNGPQI